MICLIVVFHHVIWNSHIAIAFQLNNPRQLGISLSFNASV